VISFREVEISDAARILKWRTSAEVSNFMLTDVDEDLKKQESWIKNSYLESNYYHWIILIDNKEVGLLNIKFLKPNEKTISWGYYIAESNFRGFGAMIPPILYNFVFAKLSVEKIYVEVFEDNLNVTSMHNLHGYVRESEFDKTVYKNDVKRKLIAFSLSAQDWMKKESYRKLVAEFPTKNWIASPFNL
jgi:UDP-4-amino-4,6-dideoxy-N-acetyl-beta-L-altrosamine N-acetyltransferase